MLTAESPYAARSFVLASCELARLDDADALPLAEILLRSEPWLTLHSSLEGIQHYFLRFDAGLWRFTVRLDGVLGGVVCVRHPWLFGPYLELIALDKPHRGKGVGHDIVCWMEEQAKPVASNIWTLVSAFNEPAQRFYAGQGFEEIVPIRDLIIPGHAEILLRKTLA